MLTLTDIQKQNILKYVDDKTYTQRAGFIFGVVVAIVSTVGFLTFSDAELKADLLYVAFMGFLVVGATLKDVIRFRNVKIQLNEGNFSASVKPILDCQKTEDVQSTDYSQSLKDSYLYSRNEPPRNSKVAIQKYYVLDRHNVKYECIRYLDYRECIERGETICVEFPTGEKFAMLGD